MTFGPSSAVHQPDPGSLGDPGPGQGAYLVHFTGRPAGTGPNPSLPSDVAAMSADERLTNILWEGAIRGSAPFRGGPPTVSFSAVAGPHLTWLINERGFPPWGLIYDRQAVFSAGGGQVYHARAEQWSKALQAGLAEWLVRLDTTPGDRSEWMHESEWRLPCESLAARPEAGLLGVLVGHPDWLPWRPFWSYTGQLVAADGSPTTDPAQGVAPDVRWNYQLPPSWPLQRWLPKPGGPRALAPASCVVRRRPDAPSRIDRQLPPDGIPD